MLSKSLVVVALVVTLAGCSSTCEITTEPQGAKVYLDGDYVGNSPCNISLGNGMFTFSYSLKLEREGYSTDIRTIIKQKDSFLAEPRWPTTIFVKLHPFNANPEASAQAPPAQPAASSPPSKAEPASEPKPDAQKARFCKECGAKQTGGNFCSGCGAKVE